MDEMRTQEQESRGRTATVKTMAGDDERRTRDETTCEKRRDETTDVRNEDETRPVCDGRGRDETSRRRDEYETGGGRRMGRDDV